MAADILHCSHHFEAEVVQDRLGSGATAPASIPPLPPDQPSIMMIHPLLWLQITNTRQTDEKKWTYISLVKTT